MISGGGDQQEDTEAGAADGSGPGHGRVRRAVPEGGLRGDRGATASEGPGRSGWDLDCTRSPLKIESRVGRVNTE